MTDLMDRILCRTANLFCWIGGLTEKIIICTEAGPIVMEKLAAGKKKEKDKKRVSWKLKEMEESRKMKEAEMQETRKFKEAEHHLKEREVLAKETEVAVHKLKVEGELAKMQSEAELIQEQKKAVMQDRMKKLLMD